MADTWSVQNENIKITSVFIPFYPVLTQVTPSRKWPRATIHFCFMCFREDLGKSIPQANANCQGTLTCAVMAWEEDKTFEGDHLK